jgi:hypothetical protein
LLPEGLIFFKIRLVLIISVITHEIFPSLSLLLIDSIVLQKKLHFSDFPATDLQVLRVKRIIFGEKPLTVSFNL